MKTDIAVFYNEKQVVDEKTSGDNFSKSPLKPKLLMAKIQNNEKIKQHLKVINGFTPFKKEMFYIAHTKTYVNDFFNGKLPMNAGLKWSNEFAESVTYTNSSLFHAIQNSINNPKQVSFSPTSGFHHAKPTNGVGFCTFSGQVIASTMIYQLYGKVGAYLDLDAHYGNSIEDSREFVKDLNKAVPKGFNVNPKDDGVAYINDLKRNLEKLKNAIIKNKVHYVVWCHGADSHEDDDLGGQVNTKQWLECSSIFYKWVLEVEKETKKQLPIVLSLFGGYRKDNYNFVLELHEKDLEICIKTLVS